MNMHVQIELFGGPEDGREVTIPAGPGGGPISPLPVPSPNSDADVANPEGVAWYEKHHQRPRGVWVYKYANASSVHERAPR